MPECTFDSDGSVGDRTPVGAAEAVTRCRAPATWLIEAPPIEALDGYVPRREYACEDHVGPLLKRSAFNVVWYLNRDADYA